MAEQLKKDAEERMRLMQQRTAPSPRTSVVVEQKRIESTPEIVSPSSNPVMTASQAAKMAVIDFRYPIFL